MYFWDKTEPVQNVPIVHERKNKMENKKTTIALIIVILLIVALIVVSYFFYDFNTKQLDLLTQEANEILESDLTTDSIEFKIKTERNYAEVEDAMKEYISKLKNIYVEMKEMVSGINPNVIFAAENVPDKNLDGIINIINEYKEKSQDLIKEYEELTTDEKIIDNINHANITIRQDYYINLYNEVMLSENMKNQYMKLEEEIKNEKGRLYERLNKVEKMKEFLKENEDSWTIENDRIQFENANRIIEYYNLFNQIVD